MVRVFWMLVGSYLTAIVVVAYGKVSASTIVYLRKAVVLVTTIVMVIASILDPAIDKSEISAWMAAGVIVGMAVGYVIWGVAYVLVWSLRKLRDLRNWIAEMARLFMKAYH